jgi:iron complex transport system ATP-binding protein
MESNTFEVFGERVWDVLALRGKLGIVSDSMAQLINPDVTCFDAVVSSFYNATNMYDMTADKKAVSASMDSLEFMDIAHLKDRLISEVSTGEARRVYIARALAHNPKALMLDEPTNALDIAAVHKFRATMSKIAKKGVTVIIATHTLQDIIPEIKTIVMLKEGKIYLNAPKKKALTEKNLEGLFGIKVELSEKNGHYLMK